MSTFGWCLDGHHADCRRQAVGPGTGQTMLCACPCHGDVADEEA